MNLSLLMREIINAITDFPDEDKLSVQEFLDHHEWGIALETICEVLKQERMVINIDTYRKITLCGYAMDMKPTLWEGIVVI